MSSPTTSPVKGQQNREVKLGFFSSPDKKEMFDYGIGIGVDGDAVIGIGIEDGEEVEIVDLPDINMS
jgi:hypothetical protein